MNKSKKNKFVLGVFMYLLSFVICYGLFKLITTKTFIPIANNAIISIADISFAIVQIVIIVKLIKSDNSLLIKVVSSVALSIVALLCGIYLLLATVFAIYDNNPFQYKGNTYYYMNTGWMDPIYEIYEKDSIITMSPLEDEGVEETFSEVDNIEKEDAKAIIELIIKRNTDSREYHINNKLD